MKTDDIRCDEKWKHRPRRRSGQLYRFAGLALLLWLCWELKALVIAVVFSLTLASAIAPVAERCELKWKVSRTITVILIYGLIAVVYSFLVAALFPTLKEQALSLYENFPKYADGLSGIYNHVRELLGENVANFSISSAEIKTYVSKFSGHALNLTSDLFTVVATGILVMFLTAFFVIEANDMWPKLLSWLPYEKRIVAARLIRPLETRLGGYIRGQLLVCVAVSTFLTIGLSLLKVEHALILGALSGLLNLVPFVGSMITAVLAILVAFNQSPMLAGFTFGLFALEQWFESNIIVPNLLGKQVELHPLVVLFSILIGASVLGVAGALIAVPVATAGMFLAEEFYLRPLKRREGESVIDGGTSSAPTTGTSNAVYSDGSELDSELKNLPTDESFEGAAAILSESAPTPTIKIESKPEPEKKSSGDTDFSS